MIFRLLLFISIFISISVYADDIKLEHYTDENGLSHNSIRHIIQDKTGKLWLGTFGGLNSFDGNEFKTFLSHSKSSKSIYNNDITALKVDNSSDHIWIGTRNGLTRYNLRTHVFKTFFPEKGNPQSISDFEIRSLYIDKFKRLWVGTMSQGVCFYDLKKEVFTRVKMDGFNYVKSIFEDKDGNIWIGSFQTGGIAKITINTDGSILNIKTYNLPILNSKEINPYVYFIYQDDKSDIFIGTREGLYKRDQLKDQFRVLPLPNTSIRNILGPYFTCVKQAPNGKYWVGTLGGLLVCDHLEDIVTGKFQWHYSILSQETSLINNFVSALYFDTSGVLWIGTENGLDKYDPFINQFKTIKDISQFIGGKIPRISGFAKTYDNHLIVSTHDNGLFLDKNKQFSVLANKYKEISGIYSYDGKIFYCGLWSGDILVYNYLTGTSKIVDLGFENIPVLSFCLLPKGKLLVGSYGQGAVIVNPKDYSFDATLKDLLPTSEINQVVVNTGGIIWFATETGVVKYNPTNNDVKTYLGNEEESKGLSDNYVKDLCIDNKGKIWVTTRHGLNSYDPLIDDFVPVYSPKELIENWITDIKCDKNGVLWLNFNNDRVGKYNTSTKELNIFYVASGNRLDIFSNKGFILFNDSLIYLAAKNGIISFSADDLYDNLISDPPFITEVKVQNKEVVPGDTINRQVILYEDINYCKEMELDYINRNFSFSFSSPSYVNERLNKYQYILEGFDNDWIGVEGNSRNIQYTNLYPGKYVFKIKASNSSGYWSDVSSYKIVIHPPFWLTYKAILLVIIILTLIIYLVHRQLKKSLHLKQELVMEKVKRERDENLNNEKLRFFTNISHELRTPISLILGPAKQLIEEGGGTDYQKSRVNLIINNSSRLLYLVNQLLDFRKAQTGELKLKASKADILTYSRNTFDSFKGLANDKKINFNFTCESDTIIGWIDRDKYDKILYNLLSNAIKFTRKYGHVDLFIGIKDNNSRQLVVEVSDDGIGIPLESQKKIFSRFYQVENSKEENTGSGIGLSLVNSLVQLHKATIEVQSTPEKGSVFMVEIPIDRDFYDDDEVFDIELKNIEKESLEKTKIKKIIQSTELKEKILVIEDNKELRNFIVEYLSDYYKVYEAENGQEGLQICRQVKPMLCVADIMMPEVDGFQFCMELKKDDEISHIPVILLTALSENDSIIKGYKLGADGYLVKPFDPSLLKIRIQNIIKSRLELKAKFSGEVESKIGVLSHSPVDEEFISNLSVLIEENMNNPDLKINLLCMEMGISSSKLYRKIKELTDLSPNEFVRTLRLKKSAQLLKTKKYNVSEVSDMVGFNDPLYFSRCFKKQFGFSPNTLIK